MILGPAGDRLARFEVCTAQMLHLTFAPDLEPNPFLRMLLLGNVLTLHPPPDGRSAGERGT